MMANTRAVATSLRIGDEALLVKMYPLDCCHYPRLGVKWLVKYKGLYIQIRLVSYSLPTQKGV